jgi:hypothetical protein
MRNRIFRIAATAVLLAALPLQAATMEPAQMGVQRYIERQLDPASIPYPADLGERLALLDTVNRSAGESVAVFKELRRDVRDEEEGAKQRRRLALLQMMRQAREARLLRAVASPRQLEEVLIDFWYSTSAAPPARAAAASERTPMGSVAPSTPYPTVAAMPSAARMAAASPMPPSGALDAGRLQTALDGAISGRTRDIVARSPAHLRAAMLLGSPDFMQH